MDELDGLLSRLARSMGSDGVQLGGENVRVEQAPEAGLEVRVTLLDDDGGVTSVASMLHPADEPSEAHPADVPFVRHAPLRVIEDRVRGVLLAMWMLGGDEDTPDAGTALAAVMRASREAGWRLDVAEGGGQPGTTGRSERPGLREGPVETENAGPFRLLKGDQLRRVETRSGPMGPVVSLAQRRDVKAADLA